MILCCQKTPLLLQSVLSFLVWEWCYLMPICERKSVWLLTEGKSVGFVENSFPFIMFYTYVYQVDSVIHPSKVQNSFYISCRRTVVRQGECEVLAGNYQTCPWSPNAINPYIAEHSTWVRETWAVWNNNPWSCSVTICSFWFWIVAGIRMYGQSK